MKFFLQIYDGLFADCKDALLTNFYLSLNNGFILQLINWFMGTYFCNQAM